MSHREQLQQQYEDAAFALLLAEIADREGEELLKEAERLNEDPSASVPEELDRACRKLLRTSARKGKTAPVRRVTARIAKLAAVAVLAAVLVVTAFAVIPHVRAGVLNLMLTLKDDGNTGMSFGHGEPVNKEEAAGKVDLFCYSMPGIPQEYNLIFSEESESSRVYYYEAAAEQLLSIDMTRGSVGSNFVVDTENAQAVTDIIVNGYAGICIEKDDAFHVVWADTDRAVFFDIWSNFLDGDTLLKLAQEIKYIEPTGTGEASNTDFSILNYALPEIPVDLPLVFVDEDEKQRALQYEDDLGHFLSIDVVKSSTGGIYTVDTEGAQEVREVTVNGHKGLLALEDGKVLLAWADAEHMVCFCICSNAVDEVAVMNMALQMEYIEPGQ